MREIKFRIFDNSEKKFLIKNEKVSRGIFKDKVSEIVDFENNSVQINNPEDERYIFLQYTGMKDINDKEIYEGDIVKVPHFSHDERIKINGVVKYVDNRAEFVIDLEDIEETFYCCNQSERFEVVGNIYENPELLEENDVEM